MDIATLGLEIKSDTVPKATSRLREFDNQAAKTEKQAAQMGAVIGRAFAIIGAAFSASKLIDYTNRWTDLNSRVELATGSMGRGAATMQRISEMARRTYSSLDQTAEAFLGNATALRELGYSTNQTLDYVEAINNALVVSGAKGQRAESVMNALNKAMGLGKLSGDNLNTVLASGGRITEVLADSLGVTTGELRKLGSEGKLTGDVIYTALVGALETLREQADGMPATIGDAFVLLDNSIMGLVGSYDAATGASAKVAEGIIWLADNIEILTPIMSGLAAVIAVALTPAIVGMTVALLANPFTWVALAIGTVVAGIVLLIQRMGGIDEAFLTTKTVAMDVWERIKSGGQSLADVMQGVALMIQGAFTRAWADIATGFAGLVGMITGPLSKLGVDLGDVGGLSSFAKGLHTQAAGQEAGSQIAFGNAGTNWGKATGAGAAMDNAGLGASWEKLQTTFTKTNEAAATLPPTLDNIATSSSAANDNAKTLGATLSDAARAAAQEWDFYRGTFNGFFGDLKSGLKDGKSFWESFGSAASNALDKIADRLLGMASNGLFDMLFGGLMGGLGNSAGAGWGMAGGFSGFSGIFGIPGMAEGGTVGRGGLSWVGEQGPELLRLPTGAQVIPNGPSMAAANGNGGITINNVINVPAGTNPETAPAIAREVAKELKRQLPDAMNQRDRNPLRRAG